MIKVTFQGNEYICHTAVKGLDYIKLYDANGSCIMAFVGVSDASQFTIDGAWSTPEPTAEDYLLDLDFRISIIELGL